MDEIRYGHQKTLSNVTFEDALARAEEELKKEGFGVLTEIDVKSTLKQKLDVDFRRYRILGACNPSFAHQALGQESHIGLLMPCNVVVQETDDKQIVVSVLDPRSVFSLVGNDSVEPLANEVDARLRRVLEAV